MSILLFTACAPATTVEKSPIAFNASEAERLIGNGTNLIQGRAQVKFGEGGDVTCAGEQVVLIPATDYAKERMLAAFDGDEVVFFPRIGPEEDAEPDAADPRFTQLVRTAMCDAEGKFEFPGLADGEFIVVAKVAWLAYGSVHSAEFMRQIRLEDGASEIVEFTHAMYRQPYRPRPIIH